MASRSSWWPSAPYARNTLLAEVFECILILGLIVELGFAFALDKPLIEKLSAVRELHAQGSLGCGVTVVLALQPGGEFFQRVCHPRNGWW